MLSDRDAAARRARGERWRAKGVDAIRIWGADSPVDVFEQEGVLVVEVGLPGVRREDILVKAEGAQLLIWARRPEEEGPRRYRIRGRRLHREYSHDLMLPPEASAERATATYLRGLLRVRIPLCMAPERPVREIEVGR